MLFLCTFFNMLVFTGALVGPDGASKVSGGTTFSTMNTTSSPLPDKSPEIAEVQRLQQASMDTGDAPSAPAPVPVVPVPTPPPGNHSHHEDSNSTTSAPTPTGDNNGTTPAPSTIAPHTPHPTPTPAPSKNYTPPTPPHHDGNNTKYPTAAPSAHSLKPTDAGASGVSFFRLMGKMLAWCILMGLGVLLYGFCLQNKYQIAYYLRHAGHCLVSINRWLLQKVRPDFNHSHNLHSGYAAMYASERNDAQEALLFDEPNSHPLFMGADPGNFGSTDVAGFGTSQHSQRYSQG
jgi:hypothetical protein